jgi:predicted dehydrogenase
MFGALSYAMRDDKGLTPVALPETEIWVDDARGLWAAFADHLTQGVPLECSGADHLNSLRMVEAAIRSATTGKTINPAELTHLAEPVDRNSPPNFVQTEKRKHLCD